MPGEGEITRRLSFSDVSLHTSNDLNKLNVLTAMNRPTQANFRRALTELNGSVARFDKMKEVAMEQCGSTNDGEAQRLKQELNALKFNTMEVDVKCRFLRAVKEGRPLPTTGDDPAVKDELQQRSDQVKRTKAANEAVRKEVEVLAAQIAEGIAQYKTTEVATALELDEVAALDACAADLATAPDSAASGRAQETELQTEVHNLEATALALEAQLATSQALLDALSKETTHLQADLATWAAQRGCRGGAADAQAAAVRSIERRDAAIIRHAQVKDAVDMLGGISIVRMDDKLLELLLSTVVPPGPAAPSPTEFTTVTHRVSLVLTAGTRTALTLAGVEVVPEVPVADLDLEALQEGGVSGIARVVRELRARIVASHQRAEILTQAAAAYAGMQWSIHEPAVAVPLNEGAVAVFHVPLEWPRSGTHVTLSALEAVAEDEAAAALCQQVAQEVSRKERQLGAMGIVPMLQALQAALA